MLKILKIGGSVFACKESNIPKLNEEVLDRICREIGEAYKYISKRGDSLIIIHGAGSYGHPIVKRTGIDKGIKRREQLVDFAETQRLQNELNCIVTKKLIAEEVPAIPSQPSSHVIMEGGSISWMPLNTIKGFLRLELVPILYGVPAYDKIQGCSILSGDEIGPYLGVNLDAKQIIHITDVDGIFTADPKKDKSAELIPFVTGENFEEVKRNLSGSTYTDVTGGMLNKLQELLVLAKRGIESLIINGLVEGNVKKALIGEKVKGTIVRL